MQLECSFLETLQLANIRLIVDAERGERTARYNLQVFWPLAMLVWIIEFPVDAGVSTLAHSTSDLRVDFSELWSISQHNLRFLHLPV